MDVKQKKFIAKEFIYLLIVLIISLVAFLYTVTFNWHQQSKIDQLTAEKENFIKEMSNFEQELQQRRHLQFELLRDYCKVFYPEYTEYDLKQSLDGWWSHMEKYKNIDTARNSWQKIWKPEIIDFHKKREINSPEELSHFVKSNSIVKNDTIILQELEKEILKTKRQKNEHIGNQFLSAEQRIFTMKVALFSFLFLFICRYLLMGFLWSRKILNIKE